MRYGERYAGKVSDAVKTFVWDELPFYSFADAQYWYHSRTWGPGHWSEDELRFLAAADRYYLLIYILNRRDAANEWVYDRTREVQAKPDNIVDLWARYHYKSTIITFAGSIQEVINDPEITIGIFSNKLDVSRPFLRQIKYELETNEPLKDLYPDVFWRDPQQDSPLWSDDRGIVVRRLGNPREPTINAHGLLDALPTGAHYRLRIYNDIVTEKSVTKTDTDQIGKTTRRWELSQNLGTHDSARAWHEGTRYDFADTWGVILERNIMPARVYAATKDGTLNGDPVFLTKEKWREVKEKQRSTVAAQMLLNPLAGEENVFLLDWCRPYEVRPQLLNIYLLGDPSMGRTKRSDRTAIAIIGIDSLGNRYLLDGYCHRMKLSQRWNAIKNLTKKWQKAPGVQMFKIAWERYGMQTDVEYFEEKIYQEKMEISIEEVAWVSEGGQSKLQRISRLEPYFRESMFWLPPKVHHPTFGICTWSIEVKRQPIIDKHGLPVLDHQGNPTSEPIEGSAEIIYRPYKGPSKAERQAAARGESHLIMQTMRRIDEDSQPYDLLREFFEEFRTAPFGAHDDFLDAMSRIQDVDPMPAVKYEKWMTDSKGLEDEAA